MPEVFPRRNLSSDAEPWGREVEKRIASLEGMADSARSGIAGQNRTTAATLGDLSRQITSLDELYRAIPKPQQATGVRTGFSVPGGWTDIATTSVSVPVGATKANVFAVGSGYLTNTAAGLVGGSMRLVAKGVASPAQPWATYSDSGGFHAGITPGYSWSLSVAEGTTLIVSLQVNPDNSSTWGASAGNYATVAALITFTG